MHVLWYIFSKYYYYLRICFIALFCFVSFCVGFWFPSAYGEIHVFLCLAFSLLLHSRNSRTVICSAIRFERRASRGPGMWEKLCIVNKNVVVLTTAEHPSGRRWAASIRFFFSFQWARDLVPCYREFLSVSLVLEDFWHLLENFFLDTRKNKIFSEILATTTVDFIARDTGGLSIPRAVEFMEALLIQARIWYQFMCIKGRIMCSLFLWLCNLSSWRCFLSLGLGWCCWRSQCGITGLAMELFWQKMKAVCTMAAMTSLFASVHVSHVNISCSTDLLV